MSVEAKFPHTQSLPAQCCGCLHMADFWTRYDQAEDSIYPIHPLAVDPALAKLAPS